MQKVVAPGRNHVHPVEPGKVLGTIQEAALKMATSRTPVMAAHEVDRLLVECHRTPLNQILMRSRHMPQALGQGKEAQSGGPRLKRKSRNKGRSETSKTGCCLDQEPADLEP
ncbi:hypothetical protein CRENBAI_026743 [Crenichthys baileyi]|uniref:Uncharacterized protein n=1 Tax=Crenichthys baileyi TaxID=28760 RepID=A0AAV9RP52_9TELE